MKEVGEDKLFAAGLLTRATEELRLHDFGDERFIADYERVIRAFNVELDLTAQGRALLGEWVQRMLTNRLRMHRDLEAHPEIYAEAIRPPIIITGLPRTGTTKLQQMLSVSPRVQALSLWKALNVAPLPGGDEARVAFARQVEQMLKQLHPQLWAAHPIPALSADEDTHLIELSFISPTLPMRAGAPFITAELTPPDQRMYEYLRTILQYLQWQGKEQDRATRPWVLKSPAHIGNLAALVRVFPGALVVHCHRNVETAMASLARLVEIARLMYVRSVDTMSLGAEVMAYWSREWERNIADRRQVNPSAYCDVQFEDLHRNAMAVMEKIHALAGLELDDPAREAMQKWEADNRAHQHGKHEYRAGHYGISADAVRDVFKTYHSYFAPHGM